MAERPGIMLYFDMAEPLKGLGYEEKGRLLEAMLDYGQFGVIPEFDGSLAIAWGFIRPKLDSDAKSYRKKVVKTTYSSYCAKEKKAGRVPKEWDEWVACEGIDTEWNRTAPVDIERYPTETQTQIQIQRQTQKSTTSSAAKSTAVSTPNPTSNTTAATGGGGKGEEDEESMRRRKIAMLAGYDSGR